MRTVVLRASLLCLLAAATGTVGCAATYFVSPRGSDANPGTSPQAPWKTLEKVNSVVFLPGDRILLEAGSRYTGQLKPQGSGAPGRPIVVDMYGEGPKPRIDGQGEVAAPLLLENVEYWEVSNLELTNESAAPEHKLSGVKVHIKDFGTAHHIHLKDLYIHDLSGDPDHDTGHGDGINWLNEGKKTKSRFDGLLIENCRIERCTRNGIWGWTGYWRRDEWYPSFNVVIRDNTLKNMGLHGIVAIGCDGALVEYNYVERPCMSGGGIGIWAWSSDNTVVQFNEVTGTSGRVDSQAFDSDWNCQNTIFQYNYSHDNTGGFLLVCTPKVEPKNLGNKTTIARYNISENDGALLSLFCLAGPLEGVHVYGNTFYVGPEIKTPFVLHWDWDGWATGGYFHNNIIYADGELRYEFGGSKDNVFDGNLYYGNHRDPPKDAYAITADPSLVRPGGGGTIGDPHKLHTLSAYRLLPGSPAIDRGVDLRSVLPADAGGRDFFGTAVPVGGAPDVGAHEFDPDAAPAAKRGS